MDFINSRTRTITEMALDGLYERQKALASNTANVLTPNYQRKDVEFEAQIQHAIKMADEREQERLQNSKMFVENPAEALKKFDPAREAFFSQNKIDENYKPTVVTDFVGQNHEGNNVSLENEMMQTAKTGTQYTILSTLLGRSFDGLEQVIKGQ
ncbi:flagellar basal body rod protein FlgB [bacterium]|nr:flagellar basal body rod protein FlgB [bacterium]